MHVRKQVAIVATATATNLFEDSMINVDVSIEWGFLFFYFRKKDALLVFVVLRYVLHLYNFFRTMITHRMLLVQMNSTYTARQNALATDDRQKWWQKWRRRQWAKCIESVANKWLDNTNGSEHTTTAIMWKA